MSGVDVSMFHFITYRNVQECKYRHILRITAYFPPLLQVIRRLEISKDGASKNSGHSSKLDYSVIQFT